MFGALVCFEEQHALSVHDGADDEHEGEEHDDEEQHTDEDDEQEQVVVVVVVVVEVDAAHFDVEGGDEQHVKDGQHSEDSGLEHTPSQNGA
jgi:hypothetical protein